jgi:hypothetical protein
LSYRWASAADLQQFYGELPRPTLRAVVLLLDDVPAGVIGLARDSGCDKLFSDAKPGFEPHLRRFQVLRAIKLVMSMVESSARDVYAVRQEDTDILVRLGFEHVEGDIYKWPN